MWCRVFAERVEEVRPTGFLEYLHSVGMHVEGHFRGDDLGWTSCQLIIPEESGSPITVERYLTEADDLRDDLNSWAAGLETAVEYAPNAASLMERMIRVRQLFTIHRPIDHANEVVLDRLIDLVCGFLASVCEGFYQIDGKGFFAADGSLLVQEY